MVKKFICFTSSLQIIAEIDFEMLKRLAGVPTGFSRKFIGIAGFFDCR